MAVSRREALRLLMLASGSAFVASAVGCRRATDDVRQVATAVPSIHSQQQSVAHRWLRERIPPPPPSAVVATDVVVIGAGLSGLAAAWWLEQDGLAVDVVDVEPRAGGSAVSTTIAGQSVALGNVYFVDRTDDLESLITATGVTVVECPDDGYRIGGTTFRDLWTDDVLRTLPSLADGEADVMRRFRDDVLTMGDRLPVYPVPETLSADHAALDAMSAASYLRRYPSVTLNAILDSYARSSMGGGLDDVNAYCLLNFYASEFGRTFDGGRRTIVGGPSVLARGLQATLRSVTTTMCALAIRETASRVHVDVADADGRIVRYEAGAVVMAGQKYMMPSLMPDLAVRRSDDLRTLQYAPYMTLHVHGTRRLVDDDIFDLWPIPGEGLYTDVINPGSLATPKSSATASIFAPLHPGQRRMLANDRMAADHALQVLDAFGRHYTADERASIDEACCWLWGHALVIPRPGSHNGPVQRLRRPFGRVAFANTDCDAAPAIEHAVGNGRRAAADVRRILRRGRG